MAVIKRYRLFLVMLAANLALFAFSPALGAKSFQVEVESLKTVILFLPPIFVLLGLLDVWVPREAMVKYLGASSGIRGPVIAYILGSVAAGPLYAAFPVAQMLLKKGCSLFNIMIFLGAWSCTKVPMLLFEAGAMGRAFMLTRLAVNIICTVIIAWLIDLAVSDEEKRRCLEFARE